MARPRGEPFRRLWTLVVLLRRGAWSVDALAQRLEVAPRTVFRDLAVLEAVPLPIHRIGEYGDTRVTIQPMPEWPRGEASPIKELRA